MELIVKIGGDQAGLQQTLNRITQQFKQTNISGMPLVSQYSAAQLAGFKNGGGPDASLKGAVAEIGEAFNPATLAIGAFATIMAAATGAVTYFISKISESAR